MSLINVKFFAVAAPEGSKYLLTGKINYIIFVPDERAEMMWWAGIAQLVEYKLPKLGVAGSSPVARSIRF